MIAAVVVVVADSNRAHARGPRPRHVGAPHVAHVQRRPRGHSERFESGVETLRVGLRHTYFVREDQDLQELQQAGAREQLPNDCPRCEAGVADESAPKPRRGDAIESRGGAGERNDLAREGGLGEFAGELFRDGRFRDAQLRECPVRDLPRTARDPLVPERPVPMPGSVEGRSLAPVCDDCAGGLGGAPERG
jgi:hypothetical protein